MRPAADEPRDSDREDFEREPEQDPADEPRMESDPVEASESTSPEGESGHPRRSSQESAQERKRNSAASSNTRRPRRFPERRKGRERQESYGDSGERSGRRPRDEYSEGGHGKRERAGGFPSEASVRESGGRMVSSEAIAFESIDQDALRVVSRLSRRGFEAYLVGGCVRDLLLGHQPKDFDVATQAHPRQIKRIFNNGRIIGRRFKLVHVIYGDNVIETSTFRAEPPQRDEEDEDLLITEDNEFGTAAEDARRRDFTINGLFLDPLSERIIDYVDGLPDIESRTLRTIGEPRVRMAEDPVRILRAVKFATRLGLSISQATWDAMRALSGELERSSPPRVAEEILRLLRSGHADRAFRMLLHCGALEVLLPEHAAWIEDKGGEEGSGYLWGLLRELDELTLTRGPSTVHFALSVLYLPIFDEVLAEELGPGPYGDGEVLGAAGQVLFQLAGTSRLSRRDIGLAKRLLANQRRFTQKPSKRFRPLLFIKSPEFGESLDLFRTASLARGGSLEDYESWLERQRRSDDVPDEELEVLRSKRRRRRRKKPRD